MKKILLTIFLSFLLVTSLYSQEGLQKVKISDFSGGQVSAFLDDTLEMNQGESFKNVVLNKKGQLSTRKGQDIFVVDIGNTAFTGIGRYDSDATTSYMIVASGTSIIRAEPAYTSWSTVKHSSLTANKDTEFIQANNLYFVLNGTNPTSWLNGINWNGGTTGAASPPTATTGAWVLNYLFLSGDPAQPDWVYFSNNLVPETFTKATDLFKVNTGDGQAIQRIEPYRINELIIYKERSIYILNATGSTPLSDWTLQPISRVTGTIAPRSVVSLGNDQWFLSSEPIAIRSLVRSEYDKILVNMVSTPIQDIFDGTADSSINLTQIAKSAGVLYDNKYLLAIPTGTSSVNNTVVVYDFISESWYLIDGWYPAAWIVYDENRLFYIDANDGRVIECFTGTIGDYDEGPEASFASDPTVAISYEWISKALDWDYPENYKQADALEVEFDTTGNYTATISIDLDNGGFQDIGTVNLAGDVVTLPELLPFTLASGGVARKTFHLQRYGEFKKMQIKVTQSGLSERCILQRVSGFAQIKPWRRE